MLASAFVPSTTSAQEGASARYEELVRAAIAAQEKGDFARAYELFASAHAFYPNARTLRAMGVAAFQEGRVIEAIGYLEASLDHPERPLDAELRDAVEELLARARTRVAAYRISVEPPSALLSLDGGPPMAVSAAPRWMLPGTHTLDIQAENYQPQHLELRATPGASEALHISLAPRPTSAALVEAPIAGAGKDAERVQALSAPVLTPRALTKIRRRRIASFILLGTAGAATLAASGLWFGAHRRVEVIADSCREHPAGGCTIEERDHELRKARLSTFEASTTAAVVVAGTSAAAAAGLWLWNRTSLTPRVEASARGASLGLSGRF